MYIFCINVFFPVQSVCIHRMFPRYMTNSRQLRQLAAVGNLYSGIGKRLVNDCLGLFLDLAQVVFALEALGINFIYIFRA